VIEHLLAVASFRPEVVVNITAFPWKNDVFRRVFEDPKLVDLCAATVSNLCRFVLDTNRHKIAATVCVSY
jgi:hypothetical protein